jgi:putative ABC transport system permease protein
MSVMLRKSWADLRLRSGRTALAVFVTALAVAGLTCTDVAERQLSADYAYTLAGTGPQADLTVVTDRGGTHLATAAALPGVRSAIESDVADTDWLVARAPGHVDLRIAAYAADPPFQLLSGRMPGPGEIIMDTGDSANGAVTVGGVVTVRTAAGPAALRVVGLSRTPGEDPALTGVSVGYMSPAGLAALPMHTFARGTDPQPPLRTHALGVRLADPAAWQATADAIGALARADEAVVLSMSPPHNGASVTGLHKIIDLVRLLVAVAIMLTGVLLANATTAAIGAEVPVIGVMKALGGTRRRIVRGYITTTAMTGLVATPIGLIAGVVAGVRLARTMAGSIPLADGPPHLSAATVALGVACGIGVPVIASAVPLWLGTRAGVRDAVAHWGIAAPGRRTSRRTRRPRVPATVVLGVRGLLRRPWPSGLSVATVALTAASFLVVHTLVVSVDRSIGTVWGDFSADVEVYASGPGAVARVRATLSAVPGIAGIERAAWYGAPTPWGKAAAWGIEPETHVFHPRLTGGRWLRAGDHDVVLLSDALATRSHIRIGEEFPVSGPAGGQPVPMTVIGTLHEETDDLSQIGSFVLPVDDAYEREGAAPATVAAFTNRVLIVGTDRSTAGTDRLTRAIDAAGRTGARGDGPITEVFPFADEAARRQRGFLPLYELLLALALVVGAVGALGLADVLGASVVRRRHEIGLMRALGASGYRVGAVCAIESAAIGGLGWLAATAVGLPLAIGAVHAFAATIMPVDVVLSPMALVTMIFATLVISALAALVPAARSAALRPSDLLRHE